jgi:hypothetical protein
VSLRAARAALGPIWLVGLAACARERVVPPSTAPGGVAIAIYQRDDQAYGVVDDRRWIDVAGDSVVLERVDPRAVLSSLMIEVISAPVAGTPELGACLRDRIPSGAGPDDGPGGVDEENEDEDENGGDADGDDDDAVAIDAAEEPRYTPVLRCAVRSGRGRALVRLLYIVPQLGYRTQHDVTMLAPDRATVSSRFTIATPGWGTRVEVALFDGMPGGDPPPRELARGMIAPGGGIAIVAAPARTVTARLRRIYDGAKPQTEYVARYPEQWRHESHPAVWVWLELDTALADGPIRAHIALAGQPVRDLDLPARGRRHAAALQLPLWIDERVRGRRHSRAEQDNGTISDAIAFSIGNTGDAAVEVWIEEVLRPVGRKTIRRAWPGEPVLIKKNLVRLPVTVPAGKTLRAGFAIDYEM